MGPMMKVLVCIDGSKASHNVVSFIKTNWVGKDFDLHFLFVEEPLSGVQVLLETDEYLELLLTLHRKIKTLIENYAEDLRQCGFTVHTTLSSGKISEQVATHCKENHFDLVVLGRNTQQSPFSSFSTSITNSVPGPVLIIKDQLYE